MARQVKLWQCSGDGTFWDANSYKVCDQVFRSSHPGSVKCWKLMKLAVQHILFWILVLSQAISASSGTSYFWAKEGCLRLDIGLPHQGCPLPLSMAHTINGDNYYLAWDIGWESKKWWGQHCFVAVKALTTHTILIVCQVLFQTLYIQECTYFSQ